MATTILTCGNLRLAVPAEARVPAVHLSQTDASVKITFENFSGTVTFEALSNPNLKQSPTPFNTSLTSSPENLTTTQPQLPHPSLQPNEKNKDDQQIASQANEIYLPEPFSSQPFASQPLTPRGYPFDSTSMPEVTDYLPSQQLGSQPFGSQPLDSSPVGTQVPTSNGQPCPNYPTNNNHDQLKQNTSSLIPPVKSSDDIRSYLQPLPLPTKDLLTKESKKETLDNEKNNNSSALPSYHTPEHHLLLAAGLTKSYMVPDSPPSDDFRLDQNDDYSDDDNDTCWRSSQLGNSKSEKKGKETKPCLKRPSSGKSTVEKTGSGSAKRVRFDDNPQYAPVDEGTAEVNGGKKDLEQVKCNVLSKRTLKPSPWKTVTLGEDSVTPGRRWGGTFTRMSDSSVVLLGGESEMHGFYKEMMIYKPLKNKWHHAVGDTPDIPGGGRAWHTATRVRDAILVFGGEKEVNGERQQTNEALMYDSTYYCWYPPSFGGTPPTARAGHCAAVIPGTMHYVVYGGIHGNKWLNDLHVLTHLDAWTKVRLANKSARPAARSYASLTSASNMLVLFGGNNKTKCFNDVHLMSSDYSWTEPIILGRAPKPRTGHTAIPSRDGKNVIIYGGWDDQGAQRLFFSDVWELRIKSQSECQWVCLYPGDNSTKSPGPRAGAALCMAQAENEDMLLFGGWYQVAYYNDVTKLLVPDTKRNT